MAIDPAQIELTLEQKRLLALKAEREGVDYATILNDWLGASVHDSEGLNGGGSPSVLDRMKARGAVGCAVGPGDLTTNPKHMEGFGTNARRRAD
jgi:hypothetical protein